jgi:LysW-gamma-L-lysine carboxypeptidase
LLSPTEKEDAVQLLLDLVSLSSPSGREEKVSDFIVYWMKKHGFHSIRKDSVGNVEGSTVRRNPGLVYCGHMDTVPGWIEVRQRKGVIYARGSSDAKGPLASMLFAGLKNLELNLPVKVLAVVGEEAGSVGIRHAVKNGLDCRYAVFGEPSGFRNLVIGYRGRLQVTARFKTKPHHASTPWLGRSALDFALDFANDVRKYGEDKNTTQRFEALSSCITRLKSGVASNVAPPSATVTVDIRFPPSLKSGHVLDHVKNLIPRARGLEVKLDVDESVEAVLSDPKSRLVKAFRRSIFRTCGKPAILIKKTGSGDMNHVVEKGIDGVTYGPGCPGTEHGDDERILISDYLRAIDVLSRLPGELWNGTEPGRQEKEI